MSALVPVTLTFDPAFDPDNPGKGDVEAGVGFSTFRARVRRARCRGVREPFEVGGVAVVMGGMAPLAASRSICGAGAVDVGSGWEAVLRKLVTEGMAASPVIVGVSGIVVVAAFWVT